MHNTLKNWKQTFAGFAPDLELTCGIVFVIALSCVFSVIPCYSDISEQFFSLESSAVISGHGKSCLQYISPKWPPLSFIRHICRISWTYYYMMQSVLWEFYIKLVNEYVNHIMFGRTYLKHLKIRVMCFFVHVTSKCWQNSLLEHLKCSLSSETD